jgi:hypothetical protein
LNWLLGGVTVYSSRMMRSLIRSNLHYVRA